MRSSIAAGSAIALIMGVSVTRGPVSPSLAAPAQATAVLPHRVIATIPLAASSPFGAVVNSISQKVYVTHMSEVNTLSVIDARTYAEKVSLALPFGPSGFVAVSEKWNRVYVSDGTNASGAVQVIDGAIDKVVATVSDATNAGNLPSMAVHDGRDRVYLARSERTPSSNLLVLSTLLDRLVTPIDVGATSIRGVVVDPVLDRAYVSVAVGAYSFPTSLLIVDLKANQVVTKVAAAGYPALDALHHMLYLVDSPNVSSPNSLLTVVNGATGAIEGAIPLSRKPLGLPAIDERRGCLYIGTTGPTLTVVDMVNRRELGMLELGAATSESFPMVPAVDKTSGRVFAPRGTDKTVYVVQGERCDTIGMPTSTPAFTDTSVPTATATATSIPPSPSPNASETATSTVKPSSTTPPTGRPSTPPPPTATPSLPPPAMCVCRVVRERVPGVVVNDAVANPDHYYGWLVPLDPGKPPSPANPPRTCLTLNNVNLDFNPFWNRPVWRVGCP